VQPWSFSHVVGVKRKLVDVFGYEPDLLGK
jgi:hypothetical protein